MHATGPKVRQFSGAAAAAKRARSIKPMKVAPIEYGDRKVYTVSAFNRGVADWLARLPTVWIEGELTDLRRQDRWQSVFFTLKDPADGSCLGVQIPRGQFDALRLDLANGERIHVLAAPSSSPPEATSGSARSRSSASASATTSPPSSA
jgi:hypothetical protein